MFVLVFYHKILLMFKALIITVISLYKEYDEQKFDINILRIKIHTVKLN